MKKLHLLYLAIALCIGIFMIVFGEHDDSPGAQLLGLVLIVVSIGVAVKRKRRKSSDETSQ